MNDLLHLKTDLKGRYGTIVQKRRSLRELEVVIRSLVASLESCASQVIRPESIYWATLANAIAGAVEATKGLLIEAAEIDEIHPIFRFCFFACLGLGFDADVREVCRIFLHIKTAAALSDSRSDLYEKLTMLRRVSTLGLSSLSGQRSLSKIQEETDPNDDEFHADMAFIKRS